MYNLYQVLSQFVEMFMVNFMMFFNFSELVFFKLIFRRLN